MARLLVSVRSTAEARTAAAGGAAIIDVKEPQRGPLGRADGSVWRAVRAATPAAVPVSVAMGEIHAWDGPGAAADLSGIHYRKLGLAGAGAHWRRDWAAIRRASPGPPWIAVAYLDWDAADAPSPAAVLEEAIAAGCAGILFDTWRKDRPAPGVDPRWLSRAREHRLLVALAGGLDESAIRRLGWLEPDYFAVRGAACALGDRGGTIEAVRVSRLAQAAAEPPSARDREATASAASSPERTQSGMPTPSR